MSAHSGSRVAIRGKFENTPCIHFETKDRLAEYSPRQQCITCLDSPTVSRTCIPDRYVTESEFDKKQISNSLWRIQPSSDAIRQLREIGREPIFLRRGRSYFPRLPHVRFLFTWLPCIFKQIRTRAVIVFSCFLNIMPMELFISFFCFFFFFCISLGSGDFDNSPWKRRLRLFLRNKTGMGYQRIFNERREEKRETFGVFFWK